MAGGPVGAASQPDSYVSGRWEAGTLDGSLHLRSHPRPQPPALNRRSAPMAVGAPHIALRKFGCQEAETTPAGDVPADVFDLDFTRAMVKLQHERIRNAALHTH